MQRSRSPGFYYGVFFFSGINTMLLSVVVPSMHLAHPGSIVLTDAQIGHIFAVQFTGQLLGPLFVTRHAGRSLLLGLAVSSIAALVLGASSAFNLIALAIYGAGLGLTMAAANTLVGTEALPHQRAPRVEMLNAFWPLGAACTPVVIRTFSRLPSQRVFLFVAATCLLTIPALFRRGPDAPLPIVDDETVTTRTPISDLAILCLLGALAVGTEASISNWAPTLSARYLRATWAAGMASTVFWMGILAGRAAASFLLKKLPWKPIAIYSSTLCAIATIALSMMVHSIALYAAVFAAAVGIAPVYPAVIARGVRMRGKNLMFLSAGIGSAALPWTIGAASSHNGSLRLSILFATAAALLLALALSVMKNEPKVQN